MASWVTEPSFWYSGKKSNIGDTSITINFAAKIKLNTSDKESNAQYSWYIYVENENGAYVDSKTSTSNEGSVSLSVNAGAKNCIKAELTITYDVEVEKTVLGITFTTTDTIYMYGSEEDGRKKVGYNSSNNKFLEESGSYTLNAYTINSASASSLWGDIKGLSDPGVTKDTATYIDGINGGEFRGKAADWLKQWQIWRSWYDQQNRYTTTTWGSVSLTSSSPISADWYNACASACIGSYTGRTGGFTQDIEAKYFRDISNKVTNFSD